MNITQQTLMSALEKVIFPDKNENIVALQMVRDISITDHIVSFSLVLPTLNNPFKKSMEKSAIAAVKSLSNNDIEVAVKFITEASEGRTDDKKILSGVKNIIAIASGKGGVGKSTVAVNLAVAMAKQGYKVGLLDADVYGPSVPKMFGNEGAQPYAEKRGKKDFIIPVEKYDVKLLSMGYFVKPEQAMIWRGAMATSALNQFLNDGDWGELDFLLIDLPPGTGDIHLTLVQTIPVTGAIIVSTPQQVALADVLKGISMFRNDKINVPILGLIENMAWFTPAELPQNKYYIFGKDGCRQLAEDNNIALLGQIPLVQSICEGGDSGNPAATDENSITGLAFNELAATVIEKIEARNKTLAPTKVVEITNHDGCSS